MREGFEDKRVLFMNFQKRSNRQFNITFVIFVSKAIGDPL